MLRLSFYKSITDSFATDYIVEAHSGKITSYNVKEKCPECLWSGNKVATDCPKKCSLFHGVSGNMEGPLAQELFEESRSIRFIYVVLVSDGDTKVLPYVKDTYELNSVTKELCVGQAGKLLAEGLKDMREKSHTPGVIKEGK